MASSKLDLMLDLETTGVLFDRTAVIQIAAVPFNLSTGEVFGDNVFNRCMMIPPHRFWQESTRQWWGQQKLEVFQSIMARAEDPRTVMQEFVNWCYPINSYRLWAKPSHFEFPFISSYCNDYDLANPFHYRDVNDLNSFIRARYLPVEPPTPDLEFVGDAHDALYDVFHQIKLLFWHYNNTKTTAAEMPDPKAFGAPRTAYTQEVLPPVAKL